MIWKYTALAVALATCLLMTSCTIEQEYLFKNDMSGSYFTRIDLGPMAEMGVDASALDTVIKSSDLEEMNAQYLSVAGISNAKSTFENNVLFTGFDFTSVAALENAFTSGSELTEGANAGLFKFTSSGKKLILDINSSGLNTFSGEETMGMEEMLTFKVKMNFERKIKKVSGKFVTFNKEANSLDFLFTPKDFQSGESDLKTVIKFK
ncbi:MAG: hypothetical protein IT223_05365 [Crocinitomicaceae bacterium]|nr:hypothetical protein [Crocinitomicaceae bacterium]